MRQLGLLLLVIAPACRFGGGGAEPPPDATGGGDIDARDSTPTVDASPAQCTPGTDSDGDNIDNCVEDADGDPFTDRAVFNGFHVVLGERPEGSGNCDHMSDYAEMESRFAAPKQEIDAYAGWTFDTKKDNVDDASFGFTPNWPMPAASERFSLRYRAKMTLAAGQHCFTVDIGETGTGLLNNNCGQVYVGGPPSKALAQIGFGAASSTSGTACIDIPSDGAYALDLVYWCFDPVTNIAHLDLKHCAGAACTPTETVPAKALQAAR